MNIWNKLEMPVNKMNSLLILFAILVFLSSISASGQQLNSTNSTDIIKSKISSEIKQQQSRLEPLQQLRNYCYQHASDSPNPVQDLVDKGFLDESFVGETCKSVQVMIANIELELLVQQQKLQDIREEEQKQRDYEAKHRSQYEAYLIENAMNNTNFNNCLDQRMSVEFCYDIYIGNRPIR